MKLGNIKLRELELSDKLKLSELLNNKKIWDNLRNKVPYPYQESDAINFIEFITKDNSQQVFAIEVNGNLCGVVGLVLQQDVYEKSAEIGYWIGEPFRGKGIASEAVKLMTDFGFNELNLRRIYAAVFEFNIASMKVLEKNGYLNEGILKKAVFKNGEVWDEHRFYRCNI